MASTTQLQARKLCIQVLQSQEDSIPVGHIYDYIKQNLDQRFRWDDIKDALHYLAENDSRVEERMRYKRTPFYRIKRGADA